jgi:hypothetical protein
MMRKCWFLLALVAVVTTSAPRAFGGLYWKVQAKYKDNPYAWVDASGPYLIVPGESHPDALDNAKERAKAVRQEDGVIDVQLVKTGELSAASTRDETPPQLVGLAPFQKLPEVDPGPYLSTPSPVASATPAATAPEAALSRTERASNNQDAASARDQDFEELEERFLNATGAARGPAPNSGVTYRVYNERLQVAEFYDSLEAAKQVALQNAQDEDARFAVGSIAHEVVKWVNGRRESYMPAYTVRSVHGQITENEVPTKP